MPLSTLASLLPVMTSRPWAPKTCSTDVRTSSFSALLLVLWSNTPSLGLSSIVMFWVPVTGWAPPR